MADNSDRDGGALTAVELAAELTAAWLGNPNTRTSAEDVPAFLARMNETIGALRVGKGKDEQQVTDEPKHVPAVSVRKSLSSPNHIVSMIDGKPYKTLRRHLSSNGLSPQEYRERYGLKADYPMVAQSYSEARREMAKKIGLGRKPGAKIPKKAPDSGSTTAPTKKRGRRPGGVAAQ